MINPGVVLLITVAIILTIGVILLLVWAGVEVSNNSGITGNTGNFLPSCSQNINISSLIQIPINDNTKCVQNGIVTSKFCIATLDKGNYDYVVAPWTSQPLDVCIGFCTGYTGGTCSGPDYNGQSAQTNFNNCMQQLSGTGCSPPVPIAANGTIIYYAFSPTCNVCDNHRSKSTSSFPFIT